MSNKKNTKLNKLSYKPIYIGIILLTFVSILSLKWGRYDIDTYEILKILKGLIFKPDELDYKASNVSVFYYIRLPRVLLAIIVGATLGSSGAVFQGVFRNPMASPNMLGVAAGCSFGAALGFIIDINLPYKVQVLSFIFGIIAVMLVYFLAKVSKGDKVVMLVLSGMVISALFSAGLSFIKYIADPFDQLPAIVFWTMGGLHRASWKFLKYVLIASVPSSIILILGAWKLNILSLGDEEAETLGVNVKVFRSLLIIITTFAIAATVSVTGSISWIGLIVPHIARILGGHDHRTVIPLSMISGSIFLLLMDNLARTMTTSEIPVGILTSLIGAPFFAYLLVKGRDNAWK